MKSWWVEIRAMVKDSAHKFSRQSGVHGTHTASGGTRLKASDVGFQRLPFDCCALSLQPWTNPVCSRSEGTVFELTNVIPFLKKYGVNPATGSKLEAADLVRLHFHKNENAKYHDPVSCESSQRRCVLSHKIRYTHISALTHYTVKEFNEHSHIVAIKTSGNVFTYETISQLNIKAKHLRDLVDDTPFTKKDLITLQDPHNVSGRDISQLHHLNKGLKLTAADGKEDTDEVNAAATGSASKILSQLRKEKEGATEAKEEGSSSRRKEVVEAPAEIPKAKVPYNAAVGSTGMMAASFTSSGLDIQTKSERQLINEDEFMFEQVASGDGLPKKKGQTRGKTKGYVQLVTNFGSLNIELHVHAAPKTCYNFLSLCSQGKYDDTTFHRNIPGFMIQGGDPTGTGRGGESIWGPPGFRDEFDRAGAFRHTARGTLSMANKGPGTNGSQFFFSYREKLPHLDSKHTVFGRLLEDEEQGKKKSTTLDKLEAVPSEPGTDRPMRSIRILNALVLENPFDEYKTNLQRRLDRENMTEEERIKREEKRRKREDDRTTW